MVDDPQSGPAMETLLADLEPSEAEPKDEKPEGEAETKTDDKAEEPSDAGEKAGEDDDGEGAKSEEDEAEEQEPKKKRASGVERLKRKLAAAESELASMRSRAPSDSAVTREAIEKEIGQPPKEEDYKGDFLAYERALTAYELDARQAARELRKANEQAQHAHEEAMREASFEHEERVAEFRGKVPDFDKTLREASHLKTSPTVESLILESDKSAHLVYHLAKNPERLDRLNRMSERQAAREIGRIEARLSLPSPKTETKAPKPVTPPKGGAAPRSQESDLDAWLASKYGKQA